MFRHDKEPDLYSIFRDGVLKYLTGQPKGGLDPWRMIPKEAHVGRQQTVGLIRKMVNRLGKEFPGAVVWQGGRLSLTENFSEFLKTHHEMGSSAEEAKGAWETMRDLRD